MLTCAKYIVIIFNFIFWLLGVGILGLSVFLYLDSHNYVNFDDPSMESYDTPFYVLMALGAIMTVVGFLGCCGAIKESGCCLGMYMFCVITMCIACGVSVWWVSHHGEDVRENIQDSVKKIIREKYGVGSDRGTDKIIDKIQEDFICCGVDGPEDWQMTRYNQGETASLDAGVTGTPGAMYKVPTSCCKRNQKDCIEMTKTFLEMNMSKRLLQYHPEGCISKVKDYTQVRWELIVIVGLVIIGSQLLAFVLSCCLCCCLTRHSEK